jgi:AcrR family transcriptional regulator
MLISAAGPCDHGAVMRADATRNLETVLLTGARVLAGDPTASMAEIAHQSGVDRSTVYRRFPTREALLAAVFQAKLDAAEQVIDEARPEEAPFAIALHRLVEGTIVVSRRWPVDLQLMLEDPEASARGAGLRARIGNLVDRGVDEAIVRSDLPDDWACEVLLALVDLAAHRQEQLAPGAAADLAVGSFLGATGVPAQRGL